MTNVCTTPPHDITGKQIKNYLPKGKDAELLIRLMNESEVILHQMKSKATLIWPWGQGTMPTMPSFKKKFGLRGAVITAVDLLKGLGKTLGMEVIRVPGATGYLDTNYKGKALKALKGLKRNDLVIVHVEAPDEAGHEGSIPKKIRAIEDFDRLVVGTVLNKCLMPNAECRIVVLPDHPTPIKVMTHTREDVPFVIYSTRGIKRQQKAIEEFNEKEAKKSKVKVAKGNELLVKLIRGKL
jgi:2,3-bisphosphoglycerate-independent phosphoglycerate mutase